MDLPKDKKFIKVRKLDIFKSDAHILVNPVNCVGVMGAGLAKEFKLRYPNMFEQYKKKCDHEQLTIGTLDWYIPINLQRDPIIVNFPTKRHWSDNSKYEYVSAGLSELRYYLDHIPQGAECTVAMPALGCGLGKLEFTGVYEVIGSVLEEGPNTILICLKP